MTDPRRVRLRLVLVGGFVLATSAAGMLISMAVLRVLGDRARLLLPTRVAAELVSDVTGALVVATLMAAALASLIGGLVARWILRQLGELRGLLLQELRAPMPQAPAAPLQEVRTLAVALRDRRDADHRDLLGLERERDELAAILAAVGEGILQLEADGRVVRANPRAKELLNLPEDAEGAPVSSLVRQAELRHLLERGLAGEGLEPVELALEDRRVLVVVQPIGPAAQRPVEPEETGVVVALVDLTEIKRLETVRRDFVANASHELKTPLTSIRGYSETLLSDDPPPEVRQQFLVTIRDNAERLQRIVDDLLDLSRLESGRWAPDVRSVCLADVAREVWRAFAGRAEEREVELAIEPSAELEVAADPLALRQILTNLLDNSLRYTSRGGRVALRAGTTPVSRAAPDPLRRPRAERLRGEAADGRAALLTFEVADTGSGIPAEALPRIFERFYRADPARSRAEGGTGLGLAIVKHLVESMGGTVEAESEFRRGTTIRVRLPAPSSRRAERTAPAV